MTKLSKKILALLMAVAMVVTMLPLGAFTALASGNTSVKQYLVDSIDGDFTVGTGVTWDAGENAAYFNGANTAFLTLNSNPLKGVTTSSGFAISFDAKRYDNSISMSRILDINDGTSSNTFAINGGVDSNTGEKYAILDKFGGSETRYNPTTFQSEEKQGVWYTITVVFDTDNSVQFYVDGTLKNSFTDTKNTLKNISSLTKTLVGASVYGTGTYDANFKGYIRNLTFFDDLYDFDYARASYEAVMSKGTIYTRMKNAYDKYVATQKLYDVEHYGSATVTTAQKQAAAKDLVIATANMGGYSRSKGEGKAWHNASSDVEIPIDYYKHIVWTNRATEFSAEVDKNWSKEKLVLPGVMVAVYENPSDVPVFPVMLETWQPTGWGKKDRSIETTYISGTTYYELRDYWYGYGTDYTKWPLYNSSNYTAHFHYTTNYSDNSHHYHNTSNGTHRFFFNKYYYTNGENISTTTHYQKITSNTVTFSSSGETNSVTNSAATQFIIDFTDLFDKIEEMQTSITDVLNYKEGGYATVLEAIDDATSYSLVDQFASLATNANASTTETKVKSVVSDMTGLIAGMNTASASPADRYQALRTVMDMSGTPVEGTTRALRDAYTGAANTLGYDATTYAAFCDEYERALAAFNDVLTNGYTGTYDGKAIGTIATDLESKFLALKKAQGVAPEMTGNALLNATDTITITNKEENADGNKVYYDITYDTGNTKSGELTLALDESDTIAPFSFDEAEGASTASIIARVKIDGNYATPTTADYTLYKAPVADKDVLQKEETITLSSENGANAGTIMYSFDNDNWEVYSAPFAPFASTTEPVLTLYVKEQGTGVTSSVATIPLVRAGSLTAVADPTPELGINYYESTSMITLPDATTYTAVKYQVQTDKQNDYGSAKDYPAGGFSANDYADNSFISIKAWAVGAEDQAVETTLYNAELYNPLAYRESFDNVEVENGETADVLKSENGYNMTAAANTISVVEGAGTKSSSTESYSWRNNVLKINANSTKPGPVVTLNKNPLNQQINAAAVKKNGVTISFWRHMEKNGATASLEASGDNTGYPWRNAIAFQKEGDNTNYYIIEVNGVQSRRVDGSNYIDFAPENQDNTQHEEGNNNGEWEHVAVTIDPNKGIHVYTNGVEHEWAVKQWDTSVSYPSGVGTFADGNTAETAQEILTFLADSSTEMTFDNGVMYEGNDFDLFLDDIRLYTKPLTQVEINNMYVDENADVQTNTQSTSHDPTSVTVYTLTNGKKVGYEYIDYNNIPDNEIADIDYYSFGTGMTIYHATDDSQTKWEVLGDSQGRCGYQNQDLFGEEYHTALAEVASWVGDTEERLSKGAGHLVWAPHVMYNLQLDKWVYYASMSSWGSLHSATFMATSSDPIKNYKYNSIVYKSDQLTPNAIDFAMFYNADYTKLYMTMGSWNWAWVTQASEYGCIYGMELNLDGTAKYPETDSMQSHGTQLARAHTADLEDYNGTYTSEGQGSGEGSYIVYIDGYYYLFVSYGGNEGSYTERVWRSTEPLGPYYSYNGHTAIDDSAEVDFTRGNQILAPFDMALYDHVFRSTGHNSLYKVKNNNGEWVWVNAVHGRPYASDTHDWIAVPDNALAKRQSGGVTGNVTLNNMVAINQDGWMVMFPNQYNGTDSYSSKLTAKEIEGIYTADDMRLSVNSSWGKEYTYTMLADEVYEDRGIAFGVKDGITFTSKFYLEYDEEKKVQYITIYTSANVDPETATPADVRYKGVVGTHTGKDKYGNTKLIPMLGMINEYGGDEDFHKQYIGEQTWAYRSGDVPDAADVVSDVDAVALDGVIYTHASDDEAKALATAQGMNADTATATSYAIYGQEIADNYQYGSETASAERYTTLTVAYPQKIDLTNPSAIYCYSDGERCRTGGYTGSNMKAVALNKGTVGFDVLTDDSSQKWYDKRTGDVVADPSAVSKDEWQYIVRYYGITGTVSDYFKYNTSEGKYTEDGVELIISYIDIKTGEQKQEFEFAYVMPNPAWAHTMSATRNKQSDWVGNNRESAIGIFNRFVDSSGSATLTYSKNIYDAMGKVDDGESEYKHGVSYYISDFDGHNFTSTDLDTLSEISTLFGNYDASVGVNSGSYYVAQHGDTDSVSYAVNSALVEVDYYVDYSDPQQYQTNNARGIITTDNNGVPTGYQFKMRSSNFLWDTYTGATIGATSSYARNNTGLKVTYDSTSTSTSNVVNTNGSYKKSTTIYGTRTWSARELLMEYDSGGVSTWNNRGTIHSNIYNYFTNNYGINNPSATSEQLDTALANQAAFTTLDNGHGNTHNWKGTATFTYKRGENTVGDGSTGSIANANGRINKNVYQEGDRSEQLGNYGIEFGTYHEIADYGIGVTAHARMLGNESYHYYNIGVATCDKGAMRQFAEEVLNRDIDMEKYAATGEIVTTGAIDSSKVSYASYKDYIRAVAKCMWFAENPTNTTAGDIADEAQYADDYAKAESDEMEYRTAYDENGHAIYNTETTGSNIFQDGTTTTDPVQAQLIKDVIEAYNNLYDVTKYAEVESEYKKTKDFFEVATKENDAYRQAQIDAGVDEDQVKDYYSEQSMTNYQTALDAITQHAVNYFIYWEEGPNKDTQTGDGTYHVTDADGNPVYNEDGTEKTIDIVDTELDNEEFWRKSALTGEDYEELKSFMRELRGSLAEPVDETPLENQIYGKEAVLDENEEVVEEAIASKRDMDIYGIYDQDENGDYYQKYSYPSWNAIDNSLKAKTDGYEYAEFVADTAADRIEEETRRETSADELSDNIGAYEIVDDTKGSSKYAVLGERNLKDLLNVATDVKYEILLDDTDENSPYKSRDQLAVEAKAEELAGLSLKLVDINDAYIAYNNAYTIVNAIDRNKYKESALADLDAEIARISEVYLDASADVAADYNSALDETVEHTMSAGDRLRLTSLTETDPITAALLTAVNGLEDYVKQFKATLTIQKDGVQIDKNGNESDRPAYTLTAKYGETFNFDTIPVGENEGVTYSITTYDGEAEDFETASSTGSKKFTFGGTSMTRIADTNMGITAKITTAPGTGDKLIKLYNIYNKLVYIGYGPGVTFDETGKKVLINGVEVAEAPQVPFYNFVEWAEKTAEEDENTLVYKSEYTADDTFTVTATGGTLSGSISGTTAKYDAELTLTASSEVYGWANKVGDKYQIIAYGSDPYSFYAGSDLAFYPITETEDGYAIDGTVVTADMIDGISVLDETGLGDEFTYNADAFVQAKLEAKAPFISVQRVRVLEGSGSYANKAVIVGTMTKNAETTINNAGMLLDKGATMTEDQLVIGKPTVKIANVLESGQFTVTANSKTAFSSVNTRGFINYNFPYTYTKANDDATSVETITVNANVLDYTTMKNA